MPGRIQDQQAVVQIPEAPDYPKHRLELLIAPCLSALPL